MTPNQTKAALEALDRLENDALASRDGYGNAREDAETIRTALSGGWRYKIGDRVKKKGVKGQWHGVVCGYYSTEITPRGYNVMSLLEIGSVQIYPEDTLEEWKDAP